MPKIDLEQIPWTNNASYPKEFAYAIAGREKQQDRRRRRPDAVRRQHRPHQAQRRCRRCAIGTRARTNSSTCWKANWCCTRTTARSCCEPGDAAGWRANGGIGHCLINRTDRDAVYLEVGTRSKNERVHYPDVDFCMERDEQRPPLVAQDRASRSRSEASSAGAPMAYENFKFDVDADGIALVTWDMPGRSMNVIDLSVIEELSKIVEQIAGDAAIKGAVITSGKDTFCAGADLTLLEAPDPHLRRDGEDAGRGGGGEPPVQREPQAVAALSAARDLRQAVGRRDQRHRARRRLRALPRLPSSHRRRQRQDPRRSARGQDRPVPRRRRYAARRAHAGARRRAAVPAQGRSASTRTAPRR